MPGVLIIEALAQAAAILTFKTHDHKADDNSVYYFVGIDKARFKKPVMPGDALELHAEIKRFTRGIWWFNARAMVNGQLATEAELMCTLRTIDSKTE
jgi:3-hydroxyacyl-[acyl-carrier-protein] dehydratase